MIKKENIISIDKTITKEDFARQSKISLKKIEEQMKIYDLSFLDYANASLLAEALNVQIIDVSSREKTIESIKKILPTKEKLPIISVAGHVDHGKTTLIDRIMSSSTAEKESGNITQNISLYKIKKKNKEFFLLDTPGHETFSFLRKFILDLSDLVVVLISAPEGVKDQTREVINHSLHKKKIICLNKIDYPNINLDLIYHELTKLNVVVDHYGGNVLTCETSAKKNQGIDNLLDNIFLELDSMELKSNKNQMPWGYVIDSYMEKGIGLKTRILLKAGEIHQGQKIIYDNEEINIKRMFSNGKLTKKTDFNSIIDIVGFEKPPQPGEMIFVTDHPKIKTILKHSNSPDMIFNKDLNLIIKANNINQLISVKNLMLNHGNIIEESVNMDITPSEIEKAIEFKATVILYGNFPTKTTENLQKQNIPYIQSNIIYKIPEILIERLKTNEVQFEKKGECEVVKVFNIGKKCIAGCKVRDGYVKLGSLCEIQREDKVISKGKVTSLKREKSNISESLKGTECGIILDNKFTFLQGDILIIQEEINQTQSKNSSQKTL